MLFSFYQCQKPPLNAIKIYKISYLYIGSHVKLIKWAITEFFTVVDAEGYLLKYHSLDFQTFVCLVLAMIKKEIVFYSYLYYINLFLKAFIFKGFY